MEDNPGESIPQIENNGDMNVARYSKGYLIESGLFGFVERNILKIVLDDNQYSVDEAKQKIENYEKGAK